MKSVLLPFSSYRGFEGQLSVTGESNCTEYLLIASPYPGKVWFVFISVFFFFFFFFSFL